MLYYSVKKIAAELKGEEKDLEKNAGYISPPLGDKRLTQL